MTKRLHIVQGGVENGDKAWLERTAKRHRRSTRAWVVPKHARVGDEVVVYVGGYGFFATAKIDSLPQPRKDWLNRYGSGLADIHVITPPISLGTIQRRLKELAWAIYPRSITTPEPAMAQRILALISERRRTRTPDISEAALEVASIDELRRVALLRATSSAPTRTSRRIYRARSFAIRNYVLMRANGVCEACGRDAPFTRPDGSAYLEPHHTSRLADEGPDHPAKVIGLCPNCHRRAHLAVDAKAFNQRLIKKLPRIERDAAR